MTDRFVAATVGAPHGLRGHVKVHSLSGETDHLLALSEVTLRKDGGERVLPVDETTTMGGILVMKFRGYDSPEAARVLSGSELMVSRSGAAPLDEGEWYVEDLKGLAVVSGGARIAKVVDVIEGGGGQLLELCLEGGGRRLVPFRSEFVGKVDTAAGVLELLAPWVLE